MVPFLVLLALETGLEIECCKALTVDCLQNASDRTVEIAFSSAVRAVASISVSGPATEVRARLEA